MEALKKNLHYLKFVKDIVIHKNKHFFTHQIINEKEITNKTISIVTTAHERSKQTYYTLNTINNCSYKDIQVIIVDDSQTDPINIELLKKFNIHIELIQIIKENKCWVNPCINYNIGFQYIRGEKVVIQNAEVCYVGDVLEYVSDNIIDNNYYVFDVKGSRNFDTNEEIYKCNILDMSIYDRDIYQGGYSSWHQHAIYNNNNYHHLTAMTLKTFNIYKGFSYDYTFGGAFDDDDLLLKIKCTPIKIVNVNSDTSKIGGIHLYHGYQVNIADKSVYVIKSNQTLMEKKRKYYEKNEKYVELSDSSDFFELQEKYNELNSY